MGGRDVHKFMSLSLKPEPGRRPPGPEEQRSERLPPPASGSA